MSDRLKTDIRGLLVDLVYQGAPLGEHRRAQRFPTTSPVLWAIGSARYRSTLSDLSLTGATIRAERGAANFSGLELWRKTKG